MAEEATTAAVPPVATENRSATTDLSTAIRVSPWILLLTATAQFVLQLDFSIVNVALATIQPELHFTAAGLQWIVTGYALTFGSLLLLAGRIGDAIGHRFALLVGLGLFAVSSLSGGLAGSPGLLIASRLVQGAGAALVAPAALAILTGAYTSTAGRTRALGIFQGSTAAGATAGIVLGGVLTEYLGWRWVLLVNLPIIAVLLVLIVLKLPNPARQPRSGPLDLPGAALITGAVALLIYGVSEGQQRGFGAWDSVTALVVAVLLAVGVVLVERRATQPILPASLLRDPARRASLIVMFLLGAVVAAYVYFVSLYLQGVLGVSAVVTGLALVPATGTVMAVSILLARRVLPRLGIKRTLLVALVLVGAGQLYLTQISDPGSYVVDVLAGVLLSAAGMGLAFPSVSVAVTSNVSPQQRGVAGGLLVSAQQVGSAVGLAALATVAAARTSTTGNLIDGYRLSYLVAAGIVVVAIIAVLALLPRMVRQPGS